MSKIVDVCKAIQTNMLEAVRYLHSCKLTACPMVWTRLCASCRSCGTSMCYILAEPMFLIPPYSVDDAEVRRSAIQVLSQMTRVDGGQTVLEATQKYVPDLLESDTETMKWTCDLLGNLAYNGSMSRKQLKTILSATKSCSLQGTFGSSLQNQRD